MSKHPEIKHKYHAKKDKLEITIHGYALKSKASRNKIMKMVMDEVERNPARLIADAKKRSKKHKKLPGLQKTNRLIEVGD